MPANKPPAQGMNGKEDAPHVPEVYVGRVTRTFVHRTRTVACLSCFIPVVLSLIGISFAFDSFAYALNAYTIRSSVIVRREDALNEVRSEAFFAETSDDDDDEDDDDRRREFPLDTTTILYDAFEGGNMLTTENVLKMAQVERAVLNTDWADFCQLAYPWDDKKDEKPRCKAPDTVLNILYKDDDLHKEQCEDGFCLIEDTDVCGTFVDWGVRPCVSRVFDWREGELADEKDFPKLLHERLCEVDGTATTLYLDSNKTCEDEKEGAVSRHTRSQYAIGWPIKGYKDRKDRADEQIFSRTFFNSEPEGQFGNNLKTNINAEVSEVSATQPNARTYVDRPVGDRTISVVWNNISSLKVFDVLFLDVAWAVISVIFVSCYIWINVGSLFLMFVGIFEIIISLPLAFFFWRGIMYQLEVEFLQFLTVYLILCIGADDIFIWCAHGRGCAALALACGPCPHGRPLRTPARQVRRLAPLSAAAGGGVPGRGKALRLDLPGVHARDGHDNGDYLLLPV